MNWDDIVFVSFVEMDLGRSWAMEVRNGTI
jgi:hypothetical protein